MQNLITIKNGSGRVDKIVGKPLEIIKELWKLDKNKTYTIEVKKYKQKRSLDSNSYAWVLMNKIAEKIGITKEEVYRQFVDDVGVFTIVAVAKENVPFVRHYWEDKGLGWITKSLGENGNIKGYDNVALYYGTSCYTQQKMSRFVEYVVSQAKELDIEVLPPYEIERLNSLWRSNK